MNDLLVGSGAINLVVAVILAAWHRARVARIPAPAATSPAPSRARAGAPPPAPRRDPVPAARTMSTEEIETRRLERELAESFSRFSDPAESSTRGRDFRGGARRPAASSMKVSVAQRSQPSSSFAPAGGPPGG